MKSTVYRVAHNKEKHTCSTYRYIYN